MAESGRLMEEQGPTPETKSKPGFVTAGGRTHRADLIDVLVRNGKLSLAHQQAAEELRGLWYALQAGMFPSPSWDGVRVSGAVNGTRGIECLSRRQLRAWRDVFNPWNWAMGRKIKLVYSAVWDNDMAITAGNIKALREGLQLFVSLQSDVRRKR